MAQLFMGQCNMELGAASDCSAGEDHKETIRRSSPRKETIIMEKSRSAILKTTVASLTRAGVKVSRHYTYPRRLRRRGVQMQGSVYVKLTNWPPGEHETCDARLTAGATYVAAAKRHSTGKSYFRTYCNMSRFRIYSLLCL